MNDSNQTSIVIPLLNKCDQSYQNHHVNRALDVETRKMIVQSFVAILEEVKETQKNAILDGCSTVDSKLDYDGIGWYSMVFDGIAWYSMVFCY